jgi:DNA primase
LNDFDRIKRAILDQIDLVDLVSEHVALKRRGSRYIACCPFHNEKTPSFNVVPDRGIFKCFGCGAAGDAFSFVQKRENVDFKEAMQILADRVGIELRYSRDASAAPGTDRSGLAKLNDWAAGFFRARLLADTPAGRETRAYLARRAVSDELSERFQLGLTSDGVPSLAEAAGRAGFGRDMLLAADLVRKSEDGRLYETFRSRLMFPIRDATKRVIGFGGRTMIDDRAKYLNTSQNVLFDKGNTLYGIDLARGAIQERNEAILVEGYMDCIALHQAGFTQAVAPLGTALTDSQVALLRRYCDEAVLLFDSDAAGDAAAERAIRLAIPRHLSVRLARIPGEKDPSDFLAAHDAAAFSDVLNGAIDALELRWLQTRKRFEADASDARRSEAVVEFVNLVAEACSSKAVDEIHRGLIANQIGRLLRIEPEEVHRLMRRTEKRLGGRRSTEPQSSSPESASPAIMAPATDAEQSAWTTLLQVLICEPALLAVVGELPDTARIADPCHRRLAERLVGLWQELGDVHGKDLLACCHDEGDAAKVIELHDAGEARGNYRATMQVALQRIRRCMDVSLLAEAKQRGSLDAIQESLMGRRHFVSSRASRRSTLIPAAEASSQPAQTTQAVSKQYDE